MSVAFNGKFIAAGSKDKIVYLLDSISLEVVHKFESIHTGIEL